MLVGILGRSCQPGSQREEEIAAAKTQREKQGCRMGQGGEEQQGCWTGWGDVQSPSVLLERIEERGFQTRTLGQEPLEGFEQRHGVSLVLLEITPAAIPAMAWGASGPFEN